MAPPLVAANKIKEYTTDCHKLSLAELVTRFGTSLNVGDVAKSGGLSPEQVLKARGVHGLNQLSPPKDLPEFIKFLLHFTDGFMVLMMIAGALCFIAQAFPGATGATNYILGGVLFAVVFLTCIMNYMQDRATSSTMDTFRKMIPEECVVVRGGKEARIPAIELVPGDLVKLSLGQRVPADLRIVSHNELKVECSSLTGEPDAIACACEPQHEEAREARNIVFNSSLVMSGSAMGVVTATGDNTLIGTVAGLATTTTVSRSTMQTEVHHFVVFILKLGVTSALILFSIGVARDNSRTGIINAFINGFVVVIVANVPEGLPATVVTCLTITAKRMAARNVFVKKPDIIETLGSCTVIASDKTGTLTQNRMTVSNLWHGRQTYAAVARSTHAALPPPRGDIAVSALVAQHRAAAAAGASASASGGGGQGGSSGPSSSATTPKHGSPALTSIAVVDGGASGTTGVTPRLGALLSSSGAAGFDALDLAANMSIGRTASFKMNDNGTSSLVLASSSLSSAPMYSAPMLARQGSIGRMNAGTLMLRTFSSFQDITSTMTWSQCDPRMRLGIIAGVCNAARFLPPPPPPPAAAHLSPAAQASLVGEPKVEGDASEAALLRWVQNYVVPIDDLRGGFPLLHMKPFNSVNKWALAVIDDPPPARRGGGGGGYRATGSASGGPPGLPFSPTASSSSSSSNPSTRNHVVLMKGAPEIVFGRCTHYLDSAGKEVAIDEDFKVEWQTAYESFGYLGERVLGFAYKTFPAPKLPGGEATSTSSTTTTTHSSGGGGAAGGLKAAFTRLPSTPEEGGEVAAAAAAAAAATGTAITAAAATAVGPRDHPTFYATKEGNEAIPVASLVFAGLVSLVDPPRDGVKEAVERCRTASIRVTMVTGDHPITAEAIALKVGIITLPTLRAVNAAAAEAGEPLVTDELADPRVRAVVRAGHEIRGLSDAQWGALLGKEEVVFARTTPEQKLEIVNHYQRLGEIVAVTGDGVNDSPALKKANIGLAMGGADASDVAREAGDIILMDSNFASIVFAIEEGRVLFDNLKKSIAYTLAHLLPELLPVLLNLAFDFPLALPGLVILTVDLLTEQGPAVSFAYEKAEAAVMLLPPRDMARDRLVSSPLLIYTYLLAGVPSALVCMLAYFSVYLWYGIPVASLAWSSQVYWRTPESGGSPDFIVGAQVFSSADQWSIYQQSVAAWYATIVINQFWHVWFCKTRHVSVFTHGLLDNMVTIYGTALAVLIVLVVIFIPGLNTIMYTLSFPGAVWTVNLIYLLYIGGITEWLKLQSRTDPHGWVSRNLCW